MQIVSTSLSTVWRKVFVAPLKYSFERFFSAIFRFIHMVYRIVVSLLPSSSVVLNKKASIAHRGAWLTPLSSWKDLYPVTTPPYLLQEFTKVSENHDMQAVLEGWYLQQKILILVLENLFNGFIGLQQDDFLRQITIATRTFDAYVLAALLPFAERTLTYHALPYVQESIAPFFDRLQQLFIDYAGTFCNEKESKGSDAHVQAYQLLRHFSPKLAATIKVHLGTIGTEHVLLRGILHSVQHSYLSHEAIPESALHCYQFIVTLSTCVDGIPYAHQKLFSLRDYSSYRLTDANSCSYRFFFWSLYSDILCQNKKSITDIEVEAELLQASSMAAFYTLLEEDRTLFEGWVHMCHCTQFGTADIGFWSDIEVVQEHLDHLMQALDGLLQFPMPQIFQKEEKREQLLLVLGETYRSPVRQLSAGIRNFQTLYNAVKKAWAEQIRHEGYPDGVRRTLFYLIDTQTPSIVAKFLEEIEKVRTIVCGPAQHDQALWLYLFRAARKGTDLTGVALFPYLRALLGEEVYYEYHPIIMEEAFEILCASLIDKTDVELGDYFWLSEAQREQLQQFLQTLV